MGDRADLITFTFFSGLNLKRHNSGTDLPYTTMCTVQKEAMLGAINTSVLCNKVKTISLSKRENNGVYVLNDIMRGLRPRVYTSMSINCRLHIHSSHSTDLNDHTPSFLSPSKQSLALCIYFITETNLFRSSSRGRSHSKLLEQTRQPRPLRPYQDLATSAALTFSSETPSFSPAQPHNSKFLTPLNL